MTRPSGGVCRRRGLDQQRKGKDAVPDVMLWMTKRDGEGVPSLEDVGDQVGGLGYVTEVDVRTEGGVMHVSFEGGKAEQEEIEGTIREAGYEIFKASHRER